MNKIELIRAEIERRMDSFKETFRQNKLEHYAIRAFEDEDILSFIDSLPEERPCEDLEKAADASWVDYEYSDSGNLYSSCYKDGFRAGVQWQKEQMMKMLNKYQEKGARCMQQSIDANEQGEATYWDGFNDACLAIEREIQEDEK